MCLALRRQKGPNLWRRFGLFLLYQKSRVVQIGHFHRTAQKRPQNASITRGCGVDFGLNFGPPHGRRSGAPKGPTASWGACRLATRRPAVLGRLRTDQKRPQNTSITRGCGVDFWATLEPSAWATLWGPKGVHCYRGCLPSSDPAACGSGVTLGDRLLPGMHAEYRPGGLRFWGDFGRPILT